tara:strand:- start:409 stop:756 length:348 start_codon:yes stop_codon:yes gene_type:complete
MELGQFVYFSNWTELFNRLLFSHVPEPFSIFGISADGSEAVYRADDIEAFAKRSPDVLTWSDRDHRENIEHFFRGRSKWRRTIGLCNLPKRFLICFECVNHLRLSALLLLVFWSS